MTGCLAHITTGLEGLLQVPAQAKGLVLLVDGSAGAREEGRHRVVAGYLQRRQFATLLLAPQPKAAAPIEDAAAIGQVAHRLLQTLAWLAGQADLKDLPVGAFGSGNGAAAAMVCAAEQPGRILAIVSRAAPLDLVASDLARVRVPVLLIVGGLDANMLRVTQQAFRKLGSLHKHLEVVPRATHLFEEAGALEHVAMAAAGWFEQHVSAQPT